MDDLTFYYSKSVQNYLSLANIKVPVSKMNDVSISCQLFADFSFSSFTSFSVVVIVAIFISDLTAIVGWFSSDLLMIFKCCSGLITFGLASSLASRLNDVSAEFVSYEYFCVWLQHLGGLYQRPLKSPLQL